MMMRSESRRDSVALKCLPCLVVGLVTVLFQLGCSDSENGRSNQSSETSTQQLALQKELTSSIMNDDVASVRSLLKQGADVNAILDKERDMRPLHLATIWSGPEMLSVLIEAGADMNVTTNLNVTPLFTAITIGQPQNALFLIEAGADLDIPNSSGTTPLIFAITGGHEELSLELIREGANVNAVTQGHKTTALMMASHNDMTAVAKALIKAKADPTIVDAHGNTALGYAKSQEMKTILASHDDG